MRKHIPLSLGLAWLLVAATACSSGSSQPARVTNYGPAAAAPVAQAPRAPAPTGTYAGPAYGGSITWHTRLADAQAEARATGKMILVTSTKPRCSLCDKFKNQIAPAVGGELTSVAVGYVYDITRPEVRDVDRLLRANLRGADLMPLVGFVTSELGWIHGFWGQRSVQQFRGDIARARSIHPVRTAALPTAQVAGDAPRLAYVTNEFGEREYGHPSDIWPAGDPEPIDAITGAPDGLPATVPAAAGPAPAGTMLADATPTTPTAGPAPLPEAPAPAAPSALPRLPAPAPEAAPAPAPRPAVAEAPAPAPVQDEAWGRIELQRALSQMQAGEFATARETLTLVRTTLADTPLAREAGKGGVALYNAKRIRLAASGAERSRYLDRARRDFANSMWAPLFDS